MLKLNNYIYACYNDFDGIDLDKEQEKELAEKIQADNRIIKKTEDDGVWLIKKEFINEVLEEYGNVIYTRDKENFKNVLTSNLIEDIESSADGLEFGKFLSIKYYNDLAVKEMLKVFQNMEEQQMIDFYYSDNYWSEIEKQCNQQIIKALKIKIKSLQGKI